MSKMSDLDIDRQRCVDYLKACGQSVIENAESMVGYEPFLANVTVTININPCEAPTINVSRDLYPGKIFIERVDS